MYYMDYLIHFHLQFYKLRNTRIWFGISEMVLDFGNGLGFGNSLGFRKWFGIWDFRNCNIKKKIRLRNANLVRILFIYCILVWTRYKS
jgi:hypothetical protein